MEVLTHSQRTNKYGQYGRSQSAYDIQDTQNIVWDRATQGVNKKLMRLAVDSKRQSRQSLMYDESLPRSRSSTVYLRDDYSNGSLQNLKITQFHDGDNARFPRMEVMSHFHYNNVDIDEPLELSLCIDENEDISELDTGQGLLVKVTAKKKSWILKRSIDDFIGLDRQIHRCIYDRRYSLLSPLGDLELEDNLTADMVQRLQDYLTRFSKLTGNNVNCGPILNWLELDNHGNHLVVMEADDSAINVPAIAAGRVIKRYQAQATDEITLDVGEFLSIIDMPPVEETIWWRGKKGYEVGFFPSHCIEILGVNDVTDKVIGDLASRPVSKRRGKFISFLRFFFKSRPSKDELMQNGILRERVFGCDLGERLALVGREIPLVLEMCSAVIEEYGIVDGIYRLSGILSNLQRLRICFDSGDEPPNLLDPRYLNDIHCISSLLKTYFRELPNPLFTHELYDKFVAAIDKEDDTEKTVAFHHVIQRLPPPHYRTMHVLLRHLNYCALQAKETNMTAKNLAIVWAPNLLRPNVDSVSALTEFRTQAIIVEYMIRNVDVFFNSNLASAAIAYYPESVESTTEDNSRPSSATTMGGTKLISLQEARLRVLHNRLGSESSTDDAASSSPRHKIRSMIEPPQLSAAPISPLPTLLSLEEAQARTRTNLSALSRGSEDGGEARNSNDADSPKRNKKWFGLFSKSKSFQDDDVPKTPMYRKKGSGRQNLVISSPTSIPGDSQFDSEVDSNHDPIDVPTNSETTTPFTKIDYDLDVPMPPDNDDIMSAIASISAKYTSMPSRNRESQKASHRRSITIGEPSEFRRLNYLSLPEPQIDIAVSKTTLESKCRSLDSDTNGDATMPLGGDVPTLPTFEKLKDNDSSKTTSSDQGIDSEFRLRAYSEGLSDTINNVPAKKIRSFSPENYCDPPMNVENSLHEETTNEANIKGDCEPARSIRKDSLPHVEENKFAPVPKETRISDYNSLSGTGKNTLCSAAARSEPSKRGSKQIIDQSSDSRTNGETIFQLVAVPRVDVQPKSNNTFKVTKKQNEESEVHHEDASLPANHCPTEKNTKDYRTRREAFAMQKLNNSFSGVLETAEQNDGLGIAAKAMIEKAKEIDQKYKIRQLSRTPEEKLKAELQAKTSDNSIIRGGGMDAIYSQRDNSVFRSESNTIGQKSVPVRLKTGDSNKEDESRVDEKAVKDSHSKCKSNSNELLNKTDLGTNQVERSYSLSVKDKVSLFNNSEKYKTSPNNIDVRSANESSSKSSSLKLSSSDQIRSTPNLYLHTEHSARPLPTSLCDRYKNLNNKEKDCGNCENNRRSTFSARTNSEDSYMKQTKQLSRQQNSSYSYHNNRRNSKDDKTNVQNSSNENKQPSRQQQSSNYSNRLKSKDDRTFVQNSSDISDRNSSKGDRNTVVADRLVSATTQRSKEHSKPPIKPRPLSEAQKQHTDSTRPPKSNVDRTSQEIEDYKFHRSTNLMSTIHQPPFFSLLHKSVSDNYLHHDDSNGKLIGRFPLTLKNGSSMNNTTGFDRNSFLKKRDSRPLSMYDNVRHSYYDNLSSARYDLV